MDKTNDLPESNRRDFLKNASLATVMAVVSGVELKAGDQSQPDDDLDSALTKIPPSPPINVGVIGLGAWGREILHQMFKLNNDPIWATKNNSPVVAICDTYPAAVLRAGKENAEAKTYDDYAKLLADPNVQAVIIATPTWTHKEIALAALAAGKHVYCEAPLANTIEDAKAIAAAARDAFKVVFQTGLQRRSHPQINFLSPFIRNKGLGKHVMVRAQHHLNDTWFQTASAQDREEALNWRLHQATSVGLFGENGIHQIDTVGQFLEQRPIAVTGFSATIRDYNDDRDVPDTVQAVFEYPHGIHFFHDLTIGCSYENAYEVYLGDKSTLLMRDFKAWLFKEKDAPLRGWEVYAQREKFYNETGLVLEDNSWAEPAYTRRMDHPALYYALNAFTSKAGSLTLELKDFAELYPDADSKDVLEHLETVPSLNSRPAATWQDGLNATVMAITANQAALKRQKITFEEEWFEF